jgi:hypothetical protein
LVILAKHAQAPSGVSSGFGFSIEATGVGRFKELFLLPLHALAPSRRFLSRHGLAKLQNVQFWKLSGEGTRTP